MFKGRALGLKVKEALLCSLAPFPAAKLIGERSLRHLRPDVLNLDGLYGLHNAVFVPSAQAALQASENKRLSAIRLLEEDVEVVPAKARLISQLSHQTTVQDRQEVEDIYKQRHSSTAIV